MATPLAAYRAPALEKPGGLPLTTNYGEPAWRSNGHATTLLKPAAMALSQLRAEHSKQFLAL
jgi:hypothetical protein